MESILHYSRTSHYVIISTITSTNFNPIIDVYHISFLYQFESVDVTEKTNIFYLIFWLTYGSLWSLSHFGPISANIRPIDMSVQVHAIFILKALLSRLNYSEEENVSKDDGSVFSGKFLNDTQLQIVKDKLYKGNLDYSLMFN